MDAAKAIGGIDTSGAQAVVAKEQAAMQPAIQRMQQESAKPMPAPPETQKAPEAPNNNQFAENGQEWVTALSVFAGLAGAFSRGHATTALNAFGSGVKGFQEGNQRMLDESHKEWEENNKAIQENNKALNDKYNTILENRKLTEQEQINQINVIAAQYHDPLMLESKTIDLKAKIMEIREQAASRLQMAALRMQEHKDLFDYTQAAKKRDNETPSISEDAADFAADAYLKEGARALQAYGRGNKATANLSYIHDKIVEKAKERGITGTDMAKIEQDFAAGMTEARAIATRSAPAKIAVKEMDKLATPMVESIKALDPTEFPDWNSIQNAMSKKTGGPKVVRAALAVQEFKTAFTNLMVRNGVPTDAARAKTDELFNTNFSLEQIEAVRDQAKISGAAVLDAIAEAKGETPSGSSNMPEGIDAELWKHLTPEEQKLWQISQ